MAIQKSTGVTPTERILADLCDRSFLRLWSYPNPYKDDGKELCDVLAVFEDRVFIFFDREGRHLDNTDSDLGTVWERWRRKVVEAQIETAHGAERYLRSGRQIFLDSGLKSPFPLEVLRDRITVHKIIVAHGAAEACKNSSAENVSGSLAVVYGHPITKPTFPFLVELDKNNPVHVLDSNTLPIVFNEFDTVWDFSSYLDAKTEAIRVLDMMVYAAEEDLLAHYYWNFDAIVNRHAVLPKDPTINGLLVPEGGWNALIQRPEYQRKKHADKVSYGWDELIQKTAQNALDGRLIGNADGLRGRSPIHEMAKEPRFFRRAIAERMGAAIAGFPDIPGRISRQVTFIPSFYEKKGYVFFQLRVRGITDYDGDYRPRRQALLQIACAAMKNKMPELETIIGIAIEPPKFSETVSEDFILLDCRIWSAEQRAHFQRLNADLKFFTSDSLVEGRMHVQAFPDAAEKL